MQSMPRRSALGPAPPHSEPARQSCPCRGTVRVTSSNTLNRAPPQASQASGTLQAHAARIGSGERGAPSPRTNKNPLLTRSCSYCCLHPQPGNLYLNSRPPHTTPHAPVPSSQLLRPLARRAARLAALAHIERGARRFGWFDQRAAKPGSPVRSSSRCDARRLLRPRSRRLDFGALPRGCTCGLRRKRRRRGGGAAQRVPLLAHALQQQLRALRL